MRYHFRKHRLLMAGAALVLGASQAPAQIVESVSFTNMYGYSFADGSGVPVDFFSGTQTSARASKTIGGNVSEVGFDLTGHASGGDFFFLHNAYCIGYCSVFMQTTITFTLTNTGTEDAFIRFDSLITPGHLGRVGLDIGIFGNFSFDVTQTTGGVQNRLYRAYGLPHASDRIGPNIDTSDAVAFNGLNRQDGANNSWSVMDWSATNLSVVLDRIGAGETTTLTYNSLISTGATDLCTDLSDCGGVQIAFGDPRNSGSVTGRSAKPTTESIIGREFTATEASAQFVEKDAPLPPPQEVLPPVVYDRAFVSQVPEPATWAMLIAGFGLAGLSLRARRSPMRVALSS